MPSTNPPLYYQLLHYCIKVDWRKNICRKLTTKIPIFYTNPQTILLNIDPWLQERDIVNKINSELHAMPGEWERLREEWRRSNDNGTNSTAAGSLTVIATTLTLMKDRLNHMQLLLREVSSRE